MILSVSPIGGNSKEVSETFQRCSTYVLLRIHACRTIRGFEPANRSSLKGPGRPSLESTYMNANASCRLHMYAREDLVRDRRVYARAFRCIIYDRRARALRFGSAIEARARV